MVEVHAAKACGMPGSENRIKLADGAARKWWDHANMVSTNERDVDECSTNRQDRRERGSSGS